MPLYIEFASGLDIAVVHMVTFGCYGLQCLVGERGLFELPCVEHGSQPRAHFAAAATYSLNRAFGEHRHALLPYP